jgi:hypothetical protein
MKDKTLEREMASAAKQVRLEYEFTKNKKTRCKIECDNCGEILMCTIIEPQDYTDCWGARCKECMGELQ